MLVLSLVITEYFVASAVDDKLYDTIGTDALFSMLIVFWIVNLVLRLLVLDREKATGMALPLEDRHTSLWRSCVNVFV